MGLDPKISWCRHETARRELRLANRTSGVGWCNRLGESTGHHPAVSPGIVIHFPLRRHGGGAGRVHRGNPGPWPSRIETVSGPAAPDTTNPRYSSNVAATRANQEDDQVTVAGAGLPGADAVRAATWLEAEQPPEPAIAPLQLLVDRGEAGAIALAQAHPGAILLLDDAKARRVAESLGLPRIGTLGVLRKAKHAGLLDAIAPLIGKLESNGI